MTEEEENLVNRLVELTKAYGWELNIAVDEDENVIGLHVGESEYLDEVIGVDTDRWGAEDPGTTH